MPRPGWHLRPRLPTVPGTLPAGHRSAPLVHVSRKTVPRLLLMRRGVGETAAVARHGHLLTPNHRRQILKRGVAVGSDGSGQGACSGDWTAGMIADRVVIPKDLPAGEYVLGWRWGASMLADV